MTFKKGVSGNPKGRALESEQRRRIARLKLEKHLEEAIAVIASQLKSSEETSSQWASKMVLEYVVGKPQQAVEVAGEGGEPLGVTVNIIKKDIGSAKP
jgi:hypothetical protein